MYIVGRKYKNLPPSNHEACLHILPLLLSVMPSRKATYWKCMHEINIFIIVVIIITPADIILSACF